MLEIYLNYNNRYKCNLIYYLIKFHRYIYNSITIMPLLIFKSRIQDYSIFIKEYISLSSRLTFFQSCHVDGKYLILFSFRYSFFRSFIMPSLISLVLLQLCIICVQLNYYYINVIAEMQISNRLKTMTQNDDSKCFEAISASFAKIVPKGQFSVYFSYNERERIRSRSNS